MIKTCQDEQPLLLQSNTTRQCSKDISIPALVRTCIKRMLFLVAVTLLILSYTLCNTSHLVHKFVPTLAVFQDAPLSYLINTSTCQLKDVPLFDAEIKRLYKNLYNANFNCDQNSPLLSITRVNFTWIHIDFPANSTWTCSATELVRDRNNDRLAMGPTFSPLSAFTNFANNLTASQWINATFPRWDSVLVTCEDIVEQLNQTHKYSRVVPLIQYYHRENPNLKPKTNIILLGIDSISRLNFLRHMKQTKGFFDNNEFIPMYGYHKVGENSFPNILPMFSGRLSNELYNESAGNDGFKFDDVQMIFEDFKKHGYMTTFIEDMPPYGFFSTRGGFSEQPTDYYLRPTNIAIWDELYYTYSCYQDQLEHELYWNYLLDLFAAFHRRANQSHFTFAHMSTLTHNYFNHAGYADKPFARFLQKLFDAGHQKNSVIMVYSDHALRFGHSVNTTLSVHEQRLPFFYLYIPDTLTLNGYNADQLRAIVRSNQHRLTSHLDLHATMLHILSGTMPTSEPHGRSLLGLIPENRTCSSAGIPVQYCLCHSYEPISLTRQIKQQSAAVVAHINQLMASHGNYCVPLLHKATYRAFESQHSLPPETHRLIHFATEPNNALFEAILHIDRQTEEIIQIENISRITEYGDESSCVSDKLDIVQYCLCWEKLKKEYK